MAKEVNLIEDFPLIDAKARKSIKELSSQYKDIANNFTTEQTDTEIILKYGNTTILTVPLNSLTPTEKAELLSSNLCFYEPTDVPDTWACVNGDRVLNVDTEAFYDLFYDPYVGTNSDGYTVTKTELGKDQSNTYPLYEYDFKPKNYNRTILLSSGMHTYELSAHFGCGWLIKSIMEKHNSNLMLKYLYENVRIKIIPIVNPWGWNQNPKTYGNCNGVNPNRNFDYNDENGDSVWEQFPVYSATKGDSNYDEWNVKGSAPFSEAEVKILRDWALKNKDVAEFWIDCHTGLGLGPWDNFIYYSSDSTLKANIETALNRLEDRIWNTYHVNPTKELRIDHPGSIRLNWAEKIAGIPGMTVEQTASNLKWGTSLNNESGDIANYCTTLLTYIMEFLVTKYDVKYTQNRVPYNIDNNMNIDFTIGSMNFNTGAIDSTKKTRVCTDFIEIESGENIYIDTDYPYFIIMGYDINKSYVRAVIISWTNTKPYNIFNNYPNIKYIRVLCKIDDSTEMTDSIISSHYVTVGTTKYTKNGSSDGNKYTITNNLSKATSSNSVISVNENSSYTTTITANKNYKINTITVIMGDVDITSAVVNNNVINISSVTGNIVITVKAIVDTQNKTPLTIVQGAVNLTTGEIDSTISNRFTTDFIDVSGTKSNEELWVDIGGIGYTENAETNNIDADNRIRTYFIEVNAGDELTIKPINNSLSHILIRGYIENDSNKYLYSSIKSITSWTDFTTGFKWTVPVGVKRIRMMFKKSDDSDITEIVGGISINDTSYTFKTLNNIQINLNNNLTYGYFIRCYDNNKNYIGGFDPRNSSIAYIEPSSSQVGGVIISDCNIFSILYKNIVSTDNILPCYYIKLTAKYSNNSDNDISIDDVEGTIITINNVDYIFVS